VKIHKYEAIANRKEKLDLERERLEKQGLKKQWPE
jgi:hypothetical protein